MSILFPFLASVLQAGSFVIDKVALSRFRVNYRVYNGVSFPLIFLITLFIFFIFKPPLAPGLFSGQIILLLLALILISVFSSIIFYRALEFDFLSEIQTIGLVKNIPIIIFSGLLFADERSPMVLMLAILASLAVIWAHYDPTKHHFKIAKKTSPYLISTLFLTPLIPILSKEILVVLDPISLALVRNGALAVIFGAIFFRESKNISFEAFGMLFLTNILTTIAGVIYFFSFKNFGIIYTVLLFSLEPLLVRLGSVVFLRERADYKNLIAFFMVLVSMIVGRIAS